MTTTQVTAPGSLAGTLRIGTDLMAIADQHGLPGPARLTLLAYDLTGFDRPAAGFVQLDFDDTPAFDAWARVLGAPRKATRYTYPDGRLVRYNATWIDPVCGFRFMLNARITIPADIESNVAWLDALEARMWADWESA